MSESTMEMEIDQREIIDDTIMSVEGENMMSDCEHCECGGSSWAPSSSTETSMSGENSRTPSLTFSTAGILRKINFSWARILPSRREAEEQNRRSEIELEQALMKSPSSPTEMEEMHGFEAWILDLSKLRMGKAFAEGSFGKIFRGTYGGEQVAIKLLERPTNDPKISEGLKKQFNREVSMLATLNHHPNVVRFIGACVKPRVWCIVTEYAKEGSLGQFIKKRKSSRGLNLIIKHALDIAEGMAHIHQNSFIHRDLKSDNLLVGNDHSIKIADFGIGRSDNGSHNMTPGTGTYRWMAPEMIANRRYTSKVDVYSFGMVLWELVTGLVPFNEMSSAAVPHFVIKLNRRPTIPNDCLPALSEIITRCWHADPNRRPTFQELIPMLNRAQLQASKTVRKARFRSG